MFLKSLSLAGFKSFARKSRFEFTRGITAIVGPNGSGKSNVADAIRWCLGEQSLKTLRGKKSQDVIFSGSDKRARLGLAEVSLELDNSDRKVPLDYSELVITRRIYRNSDIEYLINGAKTKLREINLLLTKANFGHRTYSVIGQGMIDNFLIASPEERKNFFEEATGVKEYQIKKNQSLNKLKNTLENLQTISVKIGEIEPQLKLLTRQVNKLNKRKDLEKKLKDLRLNYYSSSWSEINGEYENYKKTLDEFITQQKNIHEQWQKLKAQLNTLVRDTSAADKFNPLRQREQELLNKKIELKERIFKLKLSLENNLTRTNYSPLPALPLSVLNQIKNDLENILASPSNTLENFIQIIQKILHQIQPFTAKESQKRAPNPAADKNRTELESLEKKLKDLDSQLNTLGSEIKNLSLSDEQTRASLWQIQRDFQNKQTELNRINNDISGLRVSLARVETKRFDLQNEIRSELGSLNNLPTGNFKKISDADKQSLREQIYKLKQQLEIIGGLDPEIETEYENTRQRYEFLTTQTNDLRQTIQVLKQLVDELDNTIKRRMKKSFDEINHFFKKYFKILFAGGRAELILLKNKPLEKDVSAETDLEKTAEEDSVINFFQPKKNTGFAGIEIEATPPGKKLKSISVLSGGERALTSIALICAIISSNPSPFIVLDEVDAALDEANSIRFADILKVIAQKTQFIIITHNRTTMEAADLLYGITMEPDGVSKLLSLKLTEAEKYTSPQKINID